MRQTVGGLRVVGVALMALFVVGCDSINSPTSIDGSYSWTVMRVAGCPGATGLLDEEVDQSFTISESGGNWSASFTDSSGASVSMSGTYSGGRIAGSVTITSGGRTIAGTIEGRAAEHDGMRELDGSVIIEFDSLQLCEGGIVDFWAMTGSATQQPPQTIEECPAVDIVFIMDTSGSMDDEAEALCNAIEGVEQRLRDLGLDEIRTTLLGITESGAEAGAEFGCLTDTVYNVAGGDGTNHPQVPGTPWPVTTYERDPNDIETIKPFELDPDDDESEEFWAPATALIAQNFNWTPDVSSSARTVRIIVPISDESPQTGRSECWTVDEAAIDNAARVAVQNRVVVSPILGTAGDDDRDECIARLAQRLADRTGGIFARTGTAVTVGTDPGTVDPVGEQIAQFIFNIVEAACAGQSQSVSLPPLPAEPPGRQLTGNETLIAFGESAEPYIINAASGVADAGFEDNNLDGPVSSAVWIPARNELWIGMGGRSGDHGSIFELDFFSRDGTFLADVNSAFSFVFAIPGITVDPATGDVFAMGDLGDILMLNTTTNPGAPTLVGDGPPSGGRGNSLVFTAEGLFGASAATYFSIDPGTGVATGIGTMDIQGLPASTVSSGFSVTSMTLLGGTVYGIVQERGGSEGSDDGAPTFLIRLASLTPQPTFQVVGQIRNPDGESLTLDGLATMPTSVLAESLPVLSTRLEN